jgi:endonuclease V-like protein UPF0215 family
MKKGIRILGISDGLSEGRDLKRATEVIGVVFRGDHWLEGVMRIPMRRNGPNPTDQIARMITSSPYSEQIRLIMTDGIVFGNHSAVDIGSLHNKTSIPVIAVSRRTKGTKMLRQVMKGVGEPMSILLTSKKKPLEIYRVGLDSADAKSVVKMSCTIDIPEPIRVARLFASTFNRLRASDSKKIKLRSRRKIRTISR